jgi:hypothetical protein
MSATVAGLTGALAGVLAARIWDYIAYVLESKRALHLAALECRGRLAKIGHAVNALPQEVRERAGRDGWRQVLEDLEPRDWRRKSIEDEISHLGSSLDRYLATMAPIRSRKLRKAHLGLYGRLTELLITRDLAPAEQLMAELDRATK